MEPSHIEVDFPNQIIKWLIFIKLTLIDIIIKIYNSFSYGLLFSDVLQINAYTLLGTGCWH